MRRLLPLVLTAVYTALALPANAADLTAGDRAALEALRADKMKKLVFHEAPRARIDKVFRDQYGNGIELADFEGKIVVLNFWATWCPPCRAEMPSIDRMAGHFEGQDVKVIALSTDRGGVKPVQRFFDDIEVENLEIYLDRTRKMGRQAGILGLPVTLILDRQGREIARLSGDAYWDTPSALAIVEMLLEKTAPADQRAAVE